MDNQQLKEPYDTAGYSLSRHPEGVLVTDKLAKRSYPSSITPRTRSGTSCAVADRLPDHIAPS
jgi:hypothetical protein